MTLPSNKKVVCIEKEETRLYAWLRCFKLLRFFRSKNSLVCMRKSAETMIIAKIYYLVMKQQY